LYGSTDKNKEIERVDQLLEGLTEHKEVQTKQIEKLNEIVKQQELKIKELQETIKGLLIQQDR